MAELLLFFFHRSQGYHQVRTLFVINVINGDKSMFVVMDQFAAGRCSTAICWKYRRRTVLSMLEKLKKTYNIKSMKKKEIINELQD